MMTQETPETAPVAKNKTSHPNLNSTLDKKKPSLLYNPPKALITTLISNNTDFKTPKKWTSTTNSKNKWEPISHKNYIKVTFMITDKTTDNKDNNKAKDN